MLIYIPTLGRVGRQATYNALPPKLQSRALLVVPATERTAHGKLPVIVCPKHGIGAVRQWIIDRHDGEKLVMLDDDLKFATRRQDDPTKFLPATPTDVARMFRALEDHLDAYTHASICTREGGNRKLNGYEYDTRMLRVLGYNVPKFRKAKVKYDRVPVMEDFDVTLQLLRAGHRNIVLCSWVQDQGSSNAAGGCSTYRTMEVQRQGAEKLKALHPEFVTIVTKPPIKSGWNQQERTDVVIQWKKAYGSSQK